MLELTVTVKRNSKEITLTADQLRKLLNALDDILEEARRRTSLATSIMSKIKKSMFDLS